MNDRSPLPRRAVRAAWISAALLFFNLCALVFEPGAIPWTIWWGLVLVQIGLGVFAGVEFWPFGERNADTTARRFFSICSMILGLGLPALAAAGWGLLILAEPMFKGMGWGRPLRLRGKVLQPRLRPGREWTRGEKPDASAIDAASRRALEALWLHDAQKEHASVPAFSRISWHLIAIGAPPELLIAVHRAALEEIDHTRRCLALAEGFGGRSHTVGEMPELLPGDLDLGGDPLLRLARESLADGCLLEDYNADIAAAGLRACREPATAGVLTRIVREERGHAELSWRLLSYAIERGGVPVARAIEKELADLERIPRPTATSDVTAPLVALANAEVLRAHGRVPDADCVPLWEARLRTTRGRVRELLRPARAAA